MRKVLKWIGIVLGILLGLVVVILIVGYVLGGMTASKTYAVPKESITVTADTATVERGMHWYRVLCADCHGEDLGGKLIFEDPTIGTFTAPNLTSGEGGAAEEMSDEEFAAAIRHGVDHDGSGLLVMPSEAYFHLSDEDLASILAYLRHAPPVETTLAPSRVAFTGRVLLGLGAFGNAYSAAAIDHYAARAPAPAPAANAEYGEYLARVTGCATCHGAKLSGGKSPDPVSPPAPNLTAGGHLAEWSEADFFTAMRTGVEPDGEAMDPLFMPWKGIGQMTDDELRAVWLYLQSLPALEDAVEEAK